MDRTDDSAKKVTVFYGEFIELGEMRNKIRSLFLHFISEKDPFQKSYCFQQIMKNIYDIQIWIENNCGDKK